jgi:hypothetical protein
MFVGLFSDSPFCFGPLLSVWFEDIFFKLSEVQRFAASFNGLISSFFYASLKDR